MTAREREGAPGAAAGPRPEPGPRRASSAGRERGASPQALTAIDLPLPRARSGKVRECFLADDRLLLVATDRISAFDCVFRQGIPGKGAVLTGISRFWFDRLGRGAQGLPRVAHHLLETDAQRVVEELGLPAEWLADLTGRVMLVRRTEPIALECVVRGYLDGSALQEYLAAGRVAGVPLPAGLVRGDRLPEPLFTPARKAQSGHDENVTFDEAARQVGHELAEVLRDLSLAIYAAGAAFLERRGLLLADTKFEFGLLPGAHPGRSARPGRSPSAEAAGRPGAPLDRSRLLLIDEVMTPDSSRIWEASAWEPGRAQASFDKQPLRDYLEDLTSRGLWDKRPPAPDLPEAVVRETAERYAEAHRRVTGLPPETRNPFPSGPVRERP
jgi:phosphoribosylaminoimidazole-succinocarboxamide synthase